MADDAKSSDKGGMLSRFTGPSGESRLLDVLRESHLLRDVPELAGLVSVSTLRELAAGAELIRQEGSDNDLFVIVSGSLDIQINGRHLTTRRAGAHVGEMSLIDSTLRRSATVVSAEHSVVLQVPEPAFADLASRQPKLWRRLAVELCRRLQDRNQLIRPPRSAPAVFLGSSKEGLPIAREIQTAFQYDDCVLTLWTDGVFTASKTAIEDLVKLSKSIDFAILLLTADDVVSKRGKSAPSPRDNVVFELGLAIGSIGRERTFMVVPRGTPLAIPTDLLGVRCLDFEGGKDETITARLAPVCNEIRKSVVNLGPM